jgi:hypothetical protein
MLARRNSLKRPTNDSMKTVTRIGITSRRVIVKKIRACDAPSTLAASSSSRGTVSKYPLSSHTLAPIAPPR